jgi:hypothetical protein
MLRYCIALPLIFTAMFVGCSSDRATAPEELVSATFGGMPPDCAGQIIPTPECEVTPEYCATLFEHDPRCPLGPEGLPSPANPIPRRLEDTVFTSRSEDFQTEQEFSVSGYTLTSSRQFFWPRYQCTPSTAEARERFTFHRGTYDASTGEVTFVPEVISDISGKACTIQDDTVGGRTLRGARAAVRIESGPSGTEIGSVDLSFAEAPGYFKSLRASDIVIDAQPQVPGCRVDQWDVRTLDGFGTYYATRSLRIRGAAGLISVRIVALCPLGTPLDR